MGKRPVSDQNPFKFVRVADPESGSLHPPASLKTILNSIDCKTRHVELVAGAPDPIIKIVDTRQVREKYKEMRKQAQATARAQARKEIQVVRVSPRVTCEMAGSGGCSEVVRMGPRCG